MTEYPAKLVPVQVSGDLHEIFIIFVKLISFLIKGVHMQGQPFPFREVDMGFDTGDPALNEAGKILRLLYITDLR
jgi:hypothetical protein